MNRMGLAAALRRGAALVLTVHTGTVSANAGLTPIEELGKSLLFDSDLSTPPGRDCAFCPGNVRMFHKNVREIDRL
jgi:hypothetical protein